MASRPLIKESFMVLNTLGVDLYTNNIFSKIRLALTLLLMSVMSFNVLLDLIFNWQGLNSMESVSMFGSFLQINIKFFMLIINRQNLVDVINKMAEFWPTNKYGKELQDQIEILHRFIKKFMKYMIIGLILAVVVFYGSSILLQTRKIPFPLYYPTDQEQSPNYELLFCLELITSAAAGCFLLGFDFLFVSLIVNLTCELKFVKTGIKKISINPKIKGDSETNLKELYIIINHHNLILGCIKKIRKFFSNLMLIIFLIYMFEMSAGMLCIIATGFPPSISSLFQYGTVTIFYLIQLYIYCATGHYLITECESVSGIVYEIDWWVKTQPELRKALVLVIQRANKPENLTAGGMFELNLSSFRKVTRSALSFFTLVNAVYKET